MKTNQEKKPLTFGEFIMAAYDALGNPQAKGVVCLAVNAHLIEFRGQNRFLMSQRVTK